MLKFFVSIYVASKLITGSHYQEPTQPRRLIYEIDGHKMVIAPKGSYEEPKYKPIN